MIAPFTLKQLRVFTTILTEKTFTKAAETLCISQSSISKQLKILENELEISLLYKKQNKLFLTENGYTFSRYAQRILALCEESCRILIDLKNGKGEKLKIGSNQIISIYIMPYLLAFIVKKCPRIHFKIKINATNILAKNVYKQKVDIALISGELSNEIKNNLKIENFVIDELNLIISNFHPFAIKIKISKKDLSNLKLITLNCDSFIKRSIATILIRNKIFFPESKIIFQLNSIESIKIAVRFGLGTTFLLSSLTEKNRKFKKIKIINTRMNRTLSLLSNPESYKSRSFAYFYREFYSLKNKIKIQ